MFAFSEVSDWIPRTDSDSLPKWPWYVGYRFSNIVTLNWLQFHCCFNEWVKGGGASCPVVHEVEEIIGDQVVEVRFNNYRHLVSVKRLMNVVLALFLDCYTRNLVKVGGSLEEEFLQLLFNLLEILFYFKIIDPPRYVLQILFGLGFNHYIK